MGMAMKTILYHGFSEIIKKSVYRKWKTYNDYGRGFYCTEHLELAKEWACSENIDGYCNQYEIDLSKLKVLHLSEYTILHWLALIVTYRKIRVSSPIQQLSIAWLKKNYLLDLSEYDVVIGYRADDFYFSFARAFIGNEISRIRCLMPCALENWKSCQQSYGCCERRVAIHKSNWQRSRG